MVRPHSLVYLTALAFLCASAARSDTTTVHVFNFEYSINPPGGPIVDPTINVGDTIHWVWDGGFHNVQSVNGIPESFSSGFHQAPFSFDYTFTQVGNWAYYCSLHGFDNGDGTAGGMAGIIHVVPEPAAALLLVVGIVLLRRR